MDETIYECQVCEHVGPAAQGDLLVECEDCGSDQLIEVSPERAAKFHEVDSELTADMILERQELEDFEGIGFERDDCDY